MFVGPVTCIATPISLSSKLPLPLVLVIETVLVPTSVSFRAKSVCYAPLVESVPLIFLATNVQTLNEVDPSEPTLEVAE